MKELLPGPRYLFRELIPRAILMAVTFKWLLPLVPFFGFHGGILAATAFGAAFTVWFSLWGAYIMGSRSVQLWLQASQGKWYMPIFHVTMLFSVPIIGLAIAAIAVPSVFTMTWIFGPLVGAVALNAVCAATHDYRN